VFLASLERDRIPSPRPIAAREIPLIDRVEEMKLLKAAVDRTVEGEGGLVFLYGEAGIGKTRLARELRAYANLRGMRVLYGRCPALFRMDGVPPYVIWKEVIKDFLETCTLDQLDRVIGLYPAEVAKLVPELSQKLRTIPQSFSISPEQEQSRLFEAVSQFITNISRETPLLLVLDDLQWTDPSSLLLLHYLARGVQKTPLLLLGAYRSTDVDGKHPLTPVLAELKRERLPQSVSLKRMSLEDASEMMRQILEQNEIPAEFCKTVYEKTRGNPFFTEEVIESLKEEDIIFKEDDKWKFKKVSAIEFPESVKNIVKTRFSRLDDECQNVLTLASFVGNDFTLEIMSTLTGIEENKLLEIMDRLIKTGFVKHTVIRGEDICSFADIIMRDVVHEEVGPFRRKKLHGLVGQTLEKVYATSVDEHLGELALHFLEGGDKDKALDYFLKAGEKAQNVYANKEAISYFQSALKLLEEKGDALRERGGVLETLGDIESIVGEYDACTRCWNDALLFWTQLNEKGRTARLHRKMANVFWDRMGKTEEAKIHREKALKILEAEPESVELATLYADMCHMLWRIGGDLAEARSWGERALELAKRLNAHEVVANTYIDLGVISSRAGEGWKIDAEYTERALKIALDNGYMESALRAYIDLAACLPEEEHERISELREKGFELAKRVGALTYRSWFGEHLAGTYMGMGDMDKAALLAEDSVALDRKSGEMTHLPMSLGLLGLIHQILGEWDKSEQYFIEALRTSQKTNEANTLLPSYFYLGWFHFGKEEYAEAREFWKKMYETAEKAGQKLPKMAAAALLLRVCVELREFEKVENSIDDIYQFFQEVKDNFWLAQVDALRAMLFRAQKRWEESIKYFKRSLQEWELINARQWNMYWFVKIFPCEYARMYLERDQPGDREKARDLLNQALEIFQKLGAKRDIEATEAKLMRIEGRQLAEPKPLGYVATGYADLDELLCGGLPSNCAIVLTSPSCNERDLLVKSFLEAGAKKGEVAFYVTINPGAAKTLADEYQSSFWLFVCNPQADAIVRDAPNVVKLKGVENLNDISIALTSAIRKLDPSVGGARRICLGLVSDVLMQHHAVQTRRWLAGLIPELQAEGFTILAVMDPRIHSSEELYAAMGLFDGEISIFEKEGEKGGGKYLKINKMSNQEYREDELPLKKKQS
jgi:tetratricopeptide (TPR) repeat protein/KaiC/GvpD/RAD55 family RecA-like ATPase